MKPGANCQKKATLGTSPYLLEQTLDKCINWHTRHAGIRLHSEYHESLF
jgi:hypothetical protein